MCYSRSKWKTALPNVQVHYLVILVDNAIKPLARVKNTFPGLNGKVRTKKVTLSNDDSHRWFVAKICLRIIDTN